MTVWNNLKWLAQNREQIESHLANPPEARGGAVRTVGPDGEFESLWSAWDGCDHGDEIYLSGTYDVQAVGDDLPFQLDYSEKQATLTGGHPSQSLIDASGATENVIEVYGVGSQDYRNLPVVRNLRIRGGDTALQINGAPHTTYPNIITEGGHGPGFELHTYEPEGVNRGSFGVTFLNCQSWGRGGPGFTEEAHAHPHSSAYAFCRSSANRGAGYVLRGSDSLVFGCTSQLNHDHGIEAHPRYNTNIKCSYIEGNCRAEKWDAAKDGPPTEIFVNRAWRATIADCYFHGVNPRGADHSHNRVQRAIRAKNCEKVAIDRCVGRRYGEGFVHLGGSKDTEVARDSHLLKDVGPGDDPVFFVRGATRTRHHGEIMAADLTQVDGQFEGDTGVHVTEDGRRMRCVWHDGTWYNGAGTPLGN